MEDLSNSKVWKTSINPKILKNLPNSEIRKTFENTEIWQTLPKSEIRKPAAEAFIEQLWSHHLIMNERRDIFFPDTIRILLLIMTTERLLALHKMLLRYAIYSIWRHKKMSRQLCDIVYHRLGSWISLPPHNVVYDFSSQLMRFITLIIALNYTCFNSDLRLHRLRNRTIVHLSH